MAVADAGSVGFFNARFDTICYNYGGYSFRPNATVPLLDGIIVPEPGIYTLAAGFACGSLGGAGAQFDVQFWRLNAAGTALGFDGVGQHIIIQDKPVANNSAIIFSLPCTELAAGDVVSFQYAQPGGGPVNTLANLNWLMVKKEGGQY
jgi:hypothetical protein